MATRTLIILGLYVLCNSFTCEPCQYNRLPNGGPTLEIERELETAGYVVGDTVWLNAEFGTEQNADGVSYSITEAGGLVLSRLVSYTPNSDTVVSARDAFSVIAVGGEVTEEVDGSDGSLILTRVGCSDGLCTFRQGYRLERPGSYLIITEGSSLSIVDPDFDLCGLPKFGRTTSLGDDNLAEANLTSTLFHAGPDIRLSEVRLDRVSAFAITVE